MNIDLELYRIFYIVAKNKHMTRASEELHISQPAISQSIKKLEDQLGGTLFLRSNKGMELTPEGEMFYDYVKGALELINNAENEFTSFKGLDKGEIKIGASTTLTKIVLMDSIKEFHKEYPNINISITNDLTDNLLIDLEKGKLDLVIYNEGINKNNNIETKRLRELRQGFFYNSEYFKDNITSLDELINIPLILQKSQSNSRKFLDKFTIKKGIILNPKTEVVSQDLVLEFTNAGFGYGFAIVDLAKRQYPNLRELKINKDVPKHNIFIAKSKNLRLPFASEKLLEYLTNN